MTLITSAYCFGNLWKYERWNKGLQQAAFTKQKICGNLEVPTKFPYQIPFQRNPQPKASAPLSLYLN